MLSNDKPLSSNLLSLPTQSLWTTMLTTILSPQNTDASTSTAYTSGSSQPSRSTQLADSQSANTSYTSSEATTPAPLHYLAPAFPVNAPAGLCGPILLGGSAYAQLGQVGQGTFGRVIHAAVLNSCRSEDVAIKLLPRGMQVKEFATFVRREILHQSSLQHPFIVSLREVFLTPSHLAIAMEYAPGGDLYQHLLMHQPSRSVPEDQARWFFQQLLVGLDYCHCKGVANRDLKLENLLLTFKEGWARPLLKICDFGYSKHELASPAKTCVGSPVYMAPEIILGPKHYDAKKSDLWSCGVILFALLYGHHPFSVTDKRYARKVVRGEYIIPETTHVSAGCVQLVQALLEPNPDKRITLKQVLELPWFHTDLPEGALAMNKFYCNYSISLDQYMSRVDEIIYRASSTALPGEDCRGLFAVVPQNIYTL